MPHEICWQYTEMHSQNQGNVERLTRPSRVKRTQSGTNLFSLSQYFPIFVARPFDVLILFYASNHPRCGRWEPVTSPELEFD